MMMLNTIRRIEEFDREHAQSMKLRGFVGPLSTEDATYLRTYWNDREAAVGLHSSNGPMIDRMCGFTRGGQARSTVDGSSHAAPAATLPSESPACWTNQEGRRLATVGCALRLLSRDHLQVLYRVFGPRDPSARYDLLGPLAPLAEYTPIVEATRQRMVDALVEQRARSARQAAEYRIATAAAVIADARIRLQRARNEIICLRELRAERGLSEGEHVELLRWRREVRAAVNRIDAAGRPALEDDAWRDIDRTISRGTDREVTTAMALAALLARSTSPSGRDAIRQIAEQTGRLLEDSCAGFLDACRTR